MAQQIAVEPKSFIGREIKEFAGNSNIWISLLLRTEAPGNKSFSTRFKTAVAGANEKLQSRLLPVDTIGRIIGPLEEMAELLAAEAQERTLAVFRSPEELRYFWLPDQCADAVIAAKNVYIRPFLKKIEGELVFYILALSQKDVRLLRCTGHSSEELDVKNAFTPNLQDFLATAKPDHVLDNRMTGGPNMGAGAVVFGTNADADSKDEYLHHFFKQVNDGVVGLLRGQEKTPLVLCGVDEALAVYRSVNSWENTPDDAVRGAPNGLRGGEMHTRAIEVLQRAKDRELESILAQHDRQAGEVAQAGVDALIQFAYEGRILHLFAAEQANVYGSFHEREFRARAHQTEHAGDEDLTNAAAVQTIVHSGRVHVMPQALVPGNRPLACIARY